MRLPPTLSPENLKVILNYTVVQKRNIEADLNEQFRYSWGRCKSVEQEFYHQLHRFLQNRRRRNQFSRIAAKHSKKNRRKLALVPSIHLYYSRKNPAESKINNMLSKVHLFAKSRDDECLVNIVWAFLESDRIKVEDVKSLFHQYSPLKHILGNVYLKSFSASSDSQWEQAIEETIELIEELKKRDDRIIDLAQDLQDSAIWIREVAESDQNDFETEFDVFLSKHKLNVDENQELTKLIDNLISAKSDPRVSCNWRSKLEKLDKTICVDTDARENINDLANRLKLTNSVQVQENLLGPLKKSIERRKEIQKKIYTDIQNLFIQISDHELELPENIDKTTSTKDAT